MKKQYEPIAEHVHEIGSVWQERLGLAHFEIEHVFLDSFADDDSGDDFKTTAACETRWNYLEAKIKWYMPSAVRHDLDHIEQTLVHELCHVLLAAEQTVIDDKLDKENADESMTSNEFDLLQAAWSERSELATEMTARALWRAWGTAVPE